MLENYYLNISDLIVCLSNRTASEIKKLFCGIDKFQIESQKYADISIELDSEIDAIDIQSAMLICRFIVDNVEYVLLRSEKRYYFELRDTETYNRYFLQYEHGSKKVEISTCDSSRHFRFLIWTAFSLSALQYGAVFIHSSAIEHQNEAVLFLGESGAGKSTQSRLWLEHISKSVLINDDSPILRIINDKLIVYGSPWSGKTPCYRNVKFTVRAFVRINKDSGNTIVQLNTLKAIAAIYPSFPPMFAYDETLADAMLEIVSQVVSRTSIYSLKCKPEADATFITHKMLYE